MIPVAEPILKRASFSARIMTYLVVCMLVLLTVLTFQVQKRNDGIKRIEAASYRSEQTSRDAQTAAVAVKQTIDSALALFGTPSAQTLYTRQQLVNIEQMLSKLTGQPVVQPPAPPSSTTTTTGG